MSTAKGSSPEKPAPRAIGPGEPDPPPVGEINRLMVAVMADVTAVGKTRQAPAAAGGYFYRSIDDLYGALWPALVEHGVVCTPQVVEQQTERIEVSNGMATHIIVTVDFVWHAPDGSTMRTRTLGEATDRADKCANKAMTSAFKNALFQTFCIPVAESQTDTEADHNEQRRPAPAKKPDAKAPAGKAPSEKLTTDLTRLKALIEEHQLGKKQADAWLKYFGELATKSKGAPVKYEKLSELPQAYVDAICQRIIENNT